MIGVSFNPTTVGGNSAILTITSDDPDENPIDIARSGTGFDPQPDINATPSSHNYGSIVVLQSASKTFVIDNAGTTNLDITGIALTGTNESEYSITSGGTPPGILIPGGQHSVAVSFNPTSLGPKTAALRFMSNDPDENPFDIPLSGAGVDNPPPETQPTFVEARNGGSTNSATVATTQPMAPAGHLFLAAVATRPFRPATGIAGLGLTWTLVKSQCAGRNQTGIEVWKAQGTTSGGPVTATLSSSGTTNAILVSAYSGEATVSPLGHVVSGNSNGVNGACAGGIDSAGYSFDLTTADPNAVVYGVATMRSKTHTPGAGYAERLEAASGSAGDTASAATEDQLFPSAGAVIVNGTFSGAVDWAAVGIVIRPELSSPIP